MYIVKNIIKESEVESQYGASIRTYFTVEGNETVLSAFTKFPMKVGQEIEGSIVTVEKDGKTYNNFKFAPKGTFHKAPSADNEAMLKKIYDEVYATRISVQSILQNLQGSGVLPKAAEGAPTLYSPIEEAFDPSQIPF